jgi:hypothetical protein
MSLDRSIPALLRIAQVPRRAATNGVFHDYVRGVFADRSPRRRAVREERSRWLNGFAQGPTR